MDDRAPLQIANYYDMLLRMPHNVPVRTYSPLVYANLHEFDVLAKLVDSFGPVIERLGKAIIRNNLHQDVGVSLLHKHFNIYGDERLVRTRSQGVMMVAPSARPTHCEVPFVWALAKTRLDEPYGLYPVEFIEIDKDVERFISVVKEVEGNARFLAEFFEILSITGASPFLGLALNVERLFDLSQGRRVVETPARQLGSRALMLQATPEEEIKAEKGTQTLWLFRGEE